MATGISLFFLAVGAILTFAVHATMQGVDLATIGVILMVLGLLGILLSLVLWDSWAPRPIRHDVLIDDDDDVPVRRTVTRRVYH
jgi:predicted membrane channel-forming protein YqfA (hemolysin III family)